MLVVLLKFIPENVFVLYTCIKIKIISIYHKCILNLKNVDFVFNNNKKSSFVTLNNECCLDVKRARLQLNHNENIVHEMTMSALLSTINM
jgi:hypothetical protein